MYKDEYEKKGFPFREFVAKLLLVMLFTVLLVWLLPRFIQPKIVQQNCAHAKGAETQECSSVAFNSLTSQIFQDNLERMKDAAISYYTTDRLPEQVGDKKKMTLGEMIENKLITKLIDKNNKEVNVEDSYVEITKMDNEYLLKVNLKDSEKEDYILVHLGCYNYCSKGLCEKVSDYEVSGATKGYYTRTSNDYVSGYNTSYTVNTKQSKGSSSKESTKTIIIEKIKEIIVPGPSSQPSKTVIINNNTTNNYYNNTTNNYYNNTTNNSTVNNNTIIIINKDEGEHHPTPTSDPTPTTEPTPTTSPVGKKYQYQYQKLTGAKLSEWSNWSEWEKTSCSTEEIKCSEGNPSCLKERQLTSRKEQVGTYRDTFTKQRQEQRLVATWTEKACANYNYIVVDNTTYAVTDTTTYTKIDTVKTTKTAAVKSAGGWTYAGRGKYANPPKDTATTHYKFVGADYSNCTNTCTTAPNFYYDAYKYTGGTLTKAGTINVQKSSSTTSQTSTSINEVEKVISVTATCSNVVTKQIPVYRTITVTDKSTINKPLYGDVCYKSEKTRTIESAASNKITWSSKNNTKLLNDGWVMTGKKREIA